MPQHIAIIMDGNGRWAKERGLKRSDGHWEGAQRAEDIAVAASRMGVKCLTLFAFSDENWERPPAEVSALMELLVHFLKSKKKRMIEEGICLATIGDLERLSPEVQAVIKEVKETTLERSRMRLNLALSYGSKNEICRAVNRAARDGIAEFTPEIIDRYLDTHEVPPLDLMIRTSGEYRVSNFLLWQMAYAEFYFTKTLWPDFKEENLLEAIEDYRCRERRFGRTSED